MNQNVGEAGAIERGRQFDQVCLVAGRENDGVGASGEIARARLAGRMHELRGLHTSGKIVASDDVVHEGGLIRRGVMVGW